jgi:hypothetical protein
MIINTKMSWLVKTKLFLKERETAAMNNLSLFKFTRPTV